MQRRFRAVDAGFIALVLAWRGHPSPELDMKRFPTPSLLVVALIGAFAAGGAWAQTAVQLGPAKAATKDAFPNAAAEADVEIGRAHVCTPVTNAHLVCRLSIDKKKNS